MSSFKNFPLLTALLGLFSSGCSQLAFVAANVPASFGGYTRLRDVAYGAMPRNTLDVYRPAHSGAAPVVVFFHGGGWNAGDKSLYKFVGAALAEQGYVAVVPNYRLYPQARFAEQMQDSAQAVSFVQRHAAEWGGDVQRVYVMGHSAGAHLAMMLGVNDSYLAAAGGSTRALRGVIGLAGPYNFLPFTYDYMPDLFGPEANYRATQPIHFVHADMPPVLLMCGRRDRTVDPRNTITMDVALRSAGARVTTVWFDKAAHADMVAALSIPARDRFPVLAALREFIASTAPLGE